MHARPSSPAHCRSSLKHHRARSSTRTPGRSGRAGQGGARRRCPAGERGHEENTCLSGKAGCLCSNRPPGKADCLCFTSTCLSLALSDKTALPRHSCFGEEGLQQPSHTRLATATADAAEVSGSEHVPPEHVGKVRMGMTIAVHAAIMDCRHWRCPPIIRWCAWRCRWPPTP